MALNPPWGDLPYDNFTVAEVVYDYAVNRGDLVEEYARKQLADVMTRKIEHSVQCATELGEANGALSVTNRVLEVLPEECWMYRVDHQDLSCAWLVGGEFSNGMTFTEDMCCLPCQIRGVLG